MNYICRALAVLSFVVAVAGTDAWAQEGDLSYGIGWQAQVEINHYGAAVRLQMRDEQSSLLAEDFGSGYEFASAFVMADVRARNVEQMVYVAMTIYWYWPEGFGSPLHQIDYIEDSVLLPGAGPGSVNLSTAAFIRYNWIGDPFLPGLIYGGDDREFQYYGGMSRVSIIGDAFNPGINDGDWLLTPNAEAGLTAAYDLASSLDGLPFAGGRLTQEARDDWEWGVDKKLAWGTADVGDSGCSSYERLGESVEPWTSTVRIRCAGHAQNPMVPAPLSWFTPVLEWEFTLTLTFGFGEVRYTLEGLSDGFPSYELYLNGHPVLEQRDSGNIEDLLGSPDTPFFRSGRIG